MIKWSACSPSSVKSRVGIQLKPAIVVQNNENNQKEAGLGPTLKSLWWQYDRPNGALTERKMTIDRYFVRSVRLKLYVRSLCSKT